MRPWQETLIDPAKMGPVAHHNRHLPEPGEVELGEYEWYHVVDSHMTTKQRGRVFRRYWLGHTEAQIAREDKVCVRTVQRAIATGLARLRVHLQRFKEG